VGFCAVRFRAGHEEGSLLTNVLGGQIGKREYKEIKYKNKMKISFSFFPSSYAMAVLFPLHKTGPALSSQKPANKDPLKFHKTFCTVG
jgi:hypothetical protein